MTISEAPPLPRQVVPARRKSTGLLRSVVVGAGEAGRALVRDLRRTSDYGLLPVAFVDDDPAKEDLGHIEGVPILGGLDDLAHVMEGQKADVVVLAIPGLDPARVRALAKVASAHGAIVHHLPSFTAALRRDVIGTDLRALRTGELIGRTEMHVASPQARARLRGRRVLVTGAGGSIGSELCRQVAAFEPASLIMLDHDESNLHRLLLETRGRASLDSDDIVVADIRDDRRMHQVFRDLRPEIVFHAAALKHLPALEKHPCEGVKSNVLGTQNLVRAAAEHEAERIVLISTDKAADPSSVLGATKRLSEIVATLEAGKTEVCAVRFGNVLGSRGSLLTVLAEQLASGQPVTVSDEEVTRYFMTIEEAVGLVLEAARLGSGGEIYVLDMGEPVRIVDLVEHFAASVHVDVRIQFTGLRPGEKLHEQLFGEAECVEPTEHPKIWRTTAPAVPAAFRSALHDLYDAASGNRVSEVRQLLRELVPGYSPPLIDLTDRPLLLTTPYPDGF